MLDVVSLSIVGCDPEILKSKLKKLKKMGLIQGIITSITRTSYKGIYMIGVI